MESKTTFTEGLMRLVSRCNSFLRPGSSRDRCLPFVVCGKTVGLVRPDIVEELRRFPAVFCIKESGVFVTPDNQTSEQTTEQVARVLAELRQRDVLCSLRGWRDEMFDVKSSFNETPVLKLERAATCSSRDRCLPFVVCGKTVGLVRPDIVEELRRFPAVFCIKESGVFVTPDNQTSEQTTEQVARVLAELRQRDVLCSLRGWRDEMFDVRSSFNETPVLKLERAATCLFGTVQYGVHLNAYTYTTSGELMMWLGRRSKTKSTYPGVLDNMCAGGLSTGLGITECLIKECQEEASVDLSYLKKVKPAGTISYFFEEERGLFPECQYVYDLVLPADFQPVNADGEVDSFQLVSIEQLKKLIITKDFKPNCALVMLDFMIRHGFITPDEEPNYAYIVEQIHVPLQTFFSNDK